MKSDLIKFRQWAESRYEEEVAHRPDVNIHKRTLKETWNQVLRKINEMIQEET